MPRTRIVLSLLLLAVAVSCTGRIADDGDGDGVPAPDAGGPPPTADAGPMWTPGGELADRQCPDGSIVSFQNFASGFVAVYCTGCHSAQIPMGMRHGAPMGVNFDTPAGIDAHAERIYARAADGYVTMPPAGGPDAAKRELLGEWLACGLAGLP